MTLRRISGPLALTALVVALLSPLSSGRLPSAGADAAVSPAGRVLVVQVHGTVDRKAGTAPDHFVYEPDVYDINGQKIGTVTHDIVFTSPSTADLVSTFHLKDGVLSNKGVEAIGPDASRPGFYLIGVHADHDTLQPDKSTGTYAGRTGRLRQSGWHDANKFPQTVTFSDFYEITFNS